MRKSGKSYAKVIRSGIFRLVKFHTQQVAGIVNTSHLPYKMVTATIP